MSAFILILFFSCSSSDDPILNTNNGTGNNNPNDNNVTDDYKLVAVNSEGGIFEIGNNTGAIAASATGMRDHLL